MSDIGIIPFPAHTRYVLWSLLEFFRKPESHSMKVEYIQTEAKKEILDHLTQGGKVKTELDDEFRSCKKAKLESMWLWLD